MTRGASLTPRQQEILDFIRNTLEILGAPPTRAEIASAFGFASHNAAEEHLKALAKKGIIVLEPGSARGIRLVEQLGLPLIGSVAAGSPILAVENVQRRYTVDPSLFKPRADFLLRVRGLSMINAGILDGDLLAVHRSSEARNGQIVVARLDDEVTVKRLRQQGGTIELIAESPDFEPIVVDSEAQTLAIEGIAVGVIRGSETM
ncbi:MAG: transcriptional repressor LexA [Candidatus Accumulibacter meliphilus]|jgi:repressor LexA|uniref:LexA repressor n=1 Tax=Candidatus Accumulibacter meliphilus TaxID=2211374 RepID=A0A369XL91_9PROT|nr:MAG: transcriptional repressor LexA [Candidatus Accumulibacter meliphilus]